MEKQMDDDEFAALQARVAAQGRVIALLLSEWMVRLGDEGRDDIMARARRIQDQASDPNNPSTVEESLSELLDLAMSVAQQRANPSGY